MTLVDHFVEAFLPGAILAAILFHVERWRGARRRLERESSARAASEMTKALVLQLKAENEQLRAQLLKEWSNLR